MSKKIQAKDKDLTNEELEILIDFLNHENMITIKSLFLENPYKASILKSATAKLENLKWNRKKR